MKHMAMGTLVLALMLGLAACEGGKQSAVEGKVVDWDDKPVGGVKVTATQVNPIKGYEESEAVTKSDGTFRITGLFPSSAYMLKFWSDKWTCTDMSIDSAPRGDTTTLPHLIRAKAQSDGQTQADRQRTPAELKKWREEKLQGFKK